MRYSSLTLIRMIPVAVSLIGTRLSRPTVLIIGRSGPRGLASIVLLLIIFVEASATPGMATVQAVIVTTILLSVFAHEITASSPQSALCRDRGVPPRGRAG